ncbi:type II toxin-antitoxin system HicB family antitoxin [Shewanella putrefaciens]|uniref:HicB-like antitoxin of toxin-antitoxin system domain-containing protein n=1 Tax=Shewanella putrefaciens (strain CN-32 / ATCC BAA-453) TaxID=319224 RepID=A4Y9J1_SHEPC|nr:type II toxin-antitoxin system HicB family antitoxin [Shewanella putrefaciens]QGS48992.1 HicB family protein [Shewanella putrefaciens]
MLYPVAIEMGDDEHAYGIIFPDLPNCFSAGDTLDEALNNAHEAAEMYLEDLAERQIPPPQASNLERLQMDPEYHGWSWAIIDVNIEPYCSVQQPQRDER